MTTIPASSLVPGDTVVRCESQPELAGWGVAVFEDGRMGDVWAHWPIAVLVLCRHNPLDLSRGSDTIERRRTWLRSDEMLTVERSSE